jgi:hypothetical protein
MFHYREGLFFKRNEDGSVTITKTTDGHEPRRWTHLRPDDNIGFCVTIEEGGWCSAVLSMTAFSERPGDWHAWMRHHKGEEDLLVGKCG